VTGTNEELRDRHLDAVVEAVCRLPIDFRHGDEAPTQLIAKSGYRGVRDLVSEDRIAACLSAHPDWIRAWITWSEDKRTSTGWFLEEDGDVWVVGYLDRSRRSPERAFGGPVAACAAFVAREIEDIASLPFGAGPPTR
jgi:hypothetical protein